MTYRYVCISGPARAWSAAMRTEGTLSPSSARRAEVLGATSTHAPAASASSCVKLHLFRDKTRQRVRFRGISTQQPPVVSEWYRMITCRVPDNARVVRKTARFEHWAIKQRCWGPRPPTPQPPAPLPARNRVFSCCANLKTRLFSRCKCVQHTPRARVPGA